MNKVFANRALGILQCFLIERRHEIDLWLLPATCCFSVPFLFESLKLNIQFYDFSFNVDNLMSYETTQHKKIGLLLVDYFGVAWSDNALSSLGSKFDCLIHDACLSDIDFAYVLHPNVDLKIYSTGKGKTVDLNGGAVGFSKQPFSLNEYGGEDSATRYQYLDSYWKKIISNSAVYEKSALAQSWIDTGTNKLPKDYEDKAKEKLEMVMKHRKDIVSIYEEKLPSGFKNFLNGAWRYSFLVEDSKVFFSELKRLGLFASNHYANVAKYINTDLSHRSSDLIEKHIINLFSDLNITKDQANQIMNVVMDLYMNKALLPLNTKNNLSHGLC